MPLHEINSLIGKITEIFPFKELQFIPSAIASWECSTKLVRRNIQIKE